MKTTYPQKIAFTLAAALLLAGCASAQSPADNDAAHTERDEVTVALDWLAQPGNAGGIIAAQHLGYYEDAGLDVTIQPGGTDATSVKVVAGGGAQFGQEYIGQVLQARSQDIDLVALASGYQKSPSVYIFHDGQDIESVEDFSGRTVYTQVASPGWEYTVEHYGLTDVTGVQFTGSYAAFAQDERAVAQAYLTDTIAELEDAGVETDSIENPTNIDYGSSIFTTQELIDSDPELVSRFLQATAKGWEYFGANIDEVAEWIQEFTPDQSIDDVIRSSESLKDFIWTGDAVEHGWGYISEDRIAEIYDLQVAQGFIPDDESLLEGLWTTEYLTD
ncbi:ABC transporter substrate-binding protein [Microbacterium gilvum]|uniref:SsuA/THI5-like domain-containing protein n=1 Tax=Microbacterium gilvum TaxID=1336204 RepID=A0ABP9AQE3_9MICO